MKIKEFLKPTIEKVIILIISLPFIPFIKCYNEVIVKCITEPCYPMLAYQKSQFLFQFLITHGNYSIYQISYSILIVGLIISYLISCSIISIINKLRKNKK